MMPTILMSLVLIDESMKVPQSVLGVMLTIAKDNQYAITIITLPDVQPSPSMPSNLGVN